MTLTPWTVYGKNISQVQDSIYPAKISINGKPLIAYTLEQDIKILRTFESYELLQHRIVLLDSSLAFFEKYTQNQENLIKELNYLVDSTNALIVNKDLQIQSYSELNNTLDKRNIELNTEITLYKKRNRRTLAYGSILILGLVTLLILK